MLSAELKTCFIRNREVKPLYKKGVVPCFTEILPNFWLTQVKETNFGEMAKNIGLNQKY